MAPPAEKIEERHGFFVPSVRSILYAVLWFFVFACTVAELGLVSQQLHRYGNTYQHYASMEYKHALGLLLCAVIVSLLLVLAHPFIGIGLASVVALILAVFFGTGAGIIRGVTPFRGRSCGRPAEEYPLKWQPYAHECSRIVSIEALSWTIWALFIIMMISNLVYKLNIRVKPTPGGWYSV